MPKVNHKWSLQVGIGGNLRTLCHRLVDRSRINLNEPVTCKSCRRRMERRRRAVESKAIDTVLSATNITLKGFRR